MNLDDPKALISTLRDMRDAGAKAHAEAGEDGGLTGTVRDLLFGINTTIDAVMSLVDSE